MDLKQLKEKNELRRMIESGKVIQLTDGAKDQLLEDMQKYLNRVGNEQNEDAAMVRDVVLQEVRRVGPANVDFEACRSLARKLSIEARKERWLEIREVFKERNVHDAPDDYIWAARRNGVELFDKPAIADKAEAPSVVQG